MKTHINIFHGKSLSEYESVIVDIMPDGLCITGNTDTLNIYEFGEFKYSVQGYSKYEDIFFDIPSEIYNKLNLFKSNVSNYRNLSIAVFDDNNKLYRNMHLEGIFLDADKCYNSDAEETGFIRVRYFINVALAINEYLFR